MNAQAAYKAFISHLHLPPCRPLFATTISKWMAQIVKKANVIIWIIKPANKIFFPRFTLLALFLFKSMTAPIIYYFIKTLITTCFSIEKYAVLTCTKNETMSHVTKMTVIRLAEINAGWSTKRILHVEIV